MSQWGSLHESADPNQCGFEVNSQNPTCNRRSRLGSVLRSAFEDTTLMQYDFYRVLKCDAIRTRALFVHTCTYALLFSNLQHMQLFTLCRKFYANPDTIWNRQVHFGSALMDPRSRVVSPTYII